MQLIRDGDFESTVNELGWASIENGQVAITQKGSCYSTEYEPNGVVATDMAQIVLREMLPETVRSGVLRVLGFTVAGSPGQASPMQYLLFLNGFGRVDPRDFVFSFLDDYDGLMSVLSWSLACGWMIEFCCTEHRFAIRTEQDNELTVFWAEGEPTQPVMVELLTNLSFEKRKW